MIAAPFAAWFAAVAVAGSTPASTEPAPAFDAWLEGLEDRTRAAFPEPEPAISEAEVDSLLEAWRATGGEARVTAAPPRWDLDVGLAAARYDRVEGPNVVPSLSLGLPTPTAVTLTGRVGRAWAAKEMTGGGGLEAAIPRRPAATVGVSWERDVATYGTPGPRGNSVLALAAGEDRADYLRREGWSAHVRAAWRRAAVRLAGSATRETSLPVRARWTIADSRHDFRANPPVDDGSVRRVELGIAAGDSTRGRWSGEVVAIGAGGALGGDFTYRTLRAGLLARRPAGAGDELRARLAGGIVGGDPPIQALHFLGGTRTLRGWGPNEIVARRFVHLGLDYTVGTDVLGVVPGLDRLRLQLVPFLDAAALFEVQDRDGAVRSPDEPFWRFAAGLGVQHNLLGIPGGTGQIRVDVARRLDRGADAYEVLAGITLER